MPQRTLFLTLFIALLPVVLLAEPPQSSAKPMKYRVKSGDCLWTISRDVLGDSLKWPVIYTANEGKIGNPNLIYPGQSFAIPPASAITKAALRKATQVAYAKAVPITNRGSPAKPMTMDRGALAASSKSPPVQAMDKGKETEKAASPPSASEEKPVASASGSAGLIILVFMIVLVGGFFLWRKMATGPSESQKPRPLSSYSEVRNVTPMPDPKPKEQPVEPPMHSAVITSISVPSEPARPVGTPNMPEAQAPPTQPATPPPAQSADKPGDSNPPPASTGHAA